MPNVKAFAIQDGNQPDERNSLHRSTCYLYGSKTKAIAIPIIRHESALKIFLRKAVEHIGICENCDISTKYAVQFVTHNSESLNKIQILVLSQGQHFVLLLQPYIHTYPCSNVPYSHCTYLSMFTRSLLPLYIPFHVHMFCTPAVHTYPCSNVPYSHCTYLNLSMFTHSLLPLYTPIHV